MPDGVRLGTISYEVVSGQWSVKTKNKKAVESSQLGCLLLFLLTDH